MALITSAASGNFNAGATWTGGIVPGVGDEARASTGHTITITANATCTEISNAGTGTFVLNSGVTLTANCTHKSATINTNVLTFSSASPATASIVGNCTAASAGSGGAVVCSGTGTLNITGSVTGGSVANSNCVLNTAGGIINITGNCTAGAATNAGGAFNSSTGTIAITGNVTASTSSGVTNNSTGQVTIIGNVNASAASGVNNASTGSLTITGSITASTAAGVNNASTATITISGGTYTASSIANAVSSTNASSVVRASGSFIYASNGMVPINTPKFILLSTPTLAKTRYALDGAGTYVDMFTADNTVIGPATTDVRSGVSYGGGMVGSCAVPAAGSVALGVPVGSTTGTALLTGAAVEAAVWGAATRTITGGTVDTLTNAPSVPSASAIASQVRTELSVELGRVDAAISTRATPANIPTADITAIKGKTDLLNTTRLAQVSTTEIVGNLLAQANS